MKKITDFGAFVEIMPGTDGLVHISQIAEQRIKSVSEVLKEGEEVMVKLDIDKQGRVKLSRREALREARSATILHRRRPRPRVTAFPPGLESPSLCLLVCACTVAELTCWTRRAIDAQQVSCGARLDGVPLPYTSSAANASIPPSALPIENPRPSAPGV